MMNDNNKSLVLCRPEKLVLASASPRRAELLSGAGLPFEVMVSEAEECTELPPEQLVLENARRKAEVVAEKAPGRLVLAADTVVALEGRVFGKPHSLAEAQEYLATLAGKCHQVWTGVCLTRAPQASISWSCVSRVYFRPLTQAQIATYLSLVNPLDKAGAYAIQQHGELIIDHIDGLLSNIIGLPVEEVLERIRPQ